MVIVDEDVSFLLRLQRRLEQDYTVLTSTGGPEALHLIRNLESVQVLVVRDEMTRLKGIDILRFVHESIPESPSIVKILISGTPAEGRIIETAGTGRIDALLNEPISPERLKNTIASRLARLRKEQRAVMRVRIDGSFPIRIDGNSGTEIELVDISERGMFLKTLAAFPQGETLPFKILFPGGDSFSVHGRIVRRDRENRGIGVEFLSMEESRRTAFLRSLADGVIMHDLPRLKSRYPFLKTEDMVLFSDGSEIASYLEQARKDETEFVAMQAHSPSHEILKMIANRPPLTCVLEGENLDVKFKTSDPIFVSFQIGYATYSFETIVYRLSGDGRRMDCIYPRIVFYSEKRYRKRFPPAGNIRIRIPLPAPHTAPIEGRILDISRDGASFIPDDGGPALLKGTPLDRIQIFEGERLLWEEKGEVRHVGLNGRTPSPRMKYGVQFGIARMAIQAPHNPHLESEEPISSRGNIHPRTIPTAQIPDPAQKPPDILRIENQHGEEIVGLLNTALPMDDEPAPVVLIPPAYGKTKETLFSLALTLVENFRLLGRQLAVIRFDGIRRKGESYKDPEASEPPYEMLNANFTQGAADIRTMLDWLDSNPRLKAGPVILISFSLSALEARIVLRERADRRRIAYWISCMGTPEFRDLMTRINCGLDFFEQYKLGIQMGVMPVLGNLVDVDPYVADGVSNKVATIGQARDDMRRFDIPITWIYGEHDRWVKTRLVRDVMSVRVDAPREVISVPTGHNARTSQEAMDLFGSITALIHRFLHGAPLTPVLPSRKSLKIMRHAEKDRLPARKLKDRKAYWRRYLIGKENLLGFEVMGMSDDYQQLLSDQLRVLDIRDGDNLLDLGGGTGLFADLLLKNGGPIPSLFTIADLIPQALLRAREKLAAHEAFLKNRVHFDLISIDLEMNRYRPVTRFLQGEIADFRELADRIENLPLESAIKIHERYSPRLHRILRGRAVTPELKEWLKNIFDTPEYRVILDLNQAARFVNRALPGEPSYRKLTLPSTLNGNMHLPIQPGRYNKVLMSLVLSYIFNPAETLSEIRRIIQPGGRLVLSSMRPDTDASGPFTRLTEKIEAMPAEALPPDWPKPRLLDSLRVFLNDAQALVDLEEAGTFDFFDPNKLQGMLEETGWEGVRTIPTFGDPPQGYIMIAAAGDRHDPSRDIL